PGRGARPGGVGRRAARAVRVGQGHRPVGRAGDAGPGARPDRRPVALRELPRRDLRPGGARGRARLRARDRARLSVSRPLAGRAARLARTAAAHRAMTLRRLFVVLAVYAVALLAACLSVYAHYRLHPASGESIESVWKKGALVRRSVGAPSGSALAEGNPRIVERVIGESPILTAPELVFAISLVPGRDGL